MFVKKRQKIAKRYNDELSGLALQIPYQHVDSYSTYHLYPIRIMQGKTKQTQRKVYNKLQSVDINVNLHYIPVYRQPYYETMGFKVGYCSTAEQYFKEVISIPIFTTLSNSQQAYVIEILRLALAGTSS